ncbi:MAG: DNA polymerase III subunit alpha, partial [Calditrichaeota bacterium]|nr:DNA polymerase III subunit alpha [Calditrichota bacterium]
MPLECHTAFSFGSGTMGPEALVKRAAELGHRSLALCDNRGLYGMVAFYKACREQGVRPILGCRFPEAGGLVVLARGAQGFGELCRLATLSQLGPGPWLGSSGAMGGHSLTPDTDHDPAAGEAHLRWSGDSAEKLGYEELRNFYGEGDLFHPEPASGLDYGEDQGGAQSPVIAGELQRRQREALRQSLLECEDCQLLLPTPQALDFLFHPEGERVPRRHGLRSPGELAGSCAVGLAPTLDRTRANVLYKRAKELGLPCVPQYPVYYDRPEDLELHQWLRAIHENRHLHGLCHSGRFRAGAWLRSPGEIRQDFAGLPEALRHEHRIEEACELQLELGGLRLPAPRLPEGITDAGDWLRTRCLEGLRRLYPGRARAEARVRLTRELAVIEELGFTGYFLVVDEIVGYARTEGLPMIGRGSAANSIVSYCLGFTEVDPVRHRLFFERFLNPCRSSPPDIDLDFSWVDRDRVLAFVYRHFGPERVAMICTMNTYALRGAIRESARILGISGEELRALTRHLPHGVSSDWETQLRETPEKFDLSPTQEPLKSVLRIARRLVGLPRHTGIHAGGIVISPGPLCDLLSLERASKGLVVTQLDMGPVEELGLLKIDLLAQRGLGVYSDLRRQLGREGQLEKMPHTVDGLCADPRVREMLREGRTMGCFYIESPGMQSLLRKLGCESYETLVAASSVIRPGVAESGMMQTFIERHRDPSKVEYLHPLMEEILSDTYGVMVYQEDVIKVAHAMAGMSLGEGDLLRRAMSGKGRSHEEMRGMKDSFVSRCVARGIAQDTAAEVWRQIESFAGYAFCKAHSASFAVLSCRVAWLKAWHPARFMAAVLSNGGGFYSAAAYVQEARRLGLRLLGPCVNHSLREYRGRDQELRVGLLALKGLSASTLHRLLDARREGGPFRSFRDLRRRSGASADELEALVQCGACDVFGATRPQLLWGVRLAEHDTNRRRQHSLFDEVEEVAPAGIEDYGWLERWLHERETLGFGLHFHPLELYDFGSLPEQCVRAADLAARLVDGHGERIRMLGWKFTDKTIRTRRDRRWMKFLSLEDTTGTWEAVLFPDVYDRHVLLSRERGPFLLEG